MSEAPPRCDVASIDGDHSYDGALQDLQDMRKLARAGGVVVMDDLWCAAGWCGAPTKAWTTAIRSGLVEQDGCEVLGCCSGWCWGRWL